jgi:hypothetical protein
MYPRNPVEQLDLDRLSGFQQSSQTAMRIIVHQQEALGHRAAYSKGALKHKLMVGVAVVVVFAFAIAQVVAAAVAAPGGGGGGPRVVM